MASQPGPTTGEQQPGNDDTGETKTIDRRNAFVRPKPMDPEKKVRIIEEYNREYQPITEYADQIVVKNVEEIRGWAARAPRTTDWEQYQEERLHREAGFAGPNRQRAPPLAEEIEAIYEDLEEKGLFEGTDAEKARQKALIWDLKTENDGFIEQLREWAQYQPSIPTPQVNRLLAMLEAVRYDAVEEEARLRKVIKENGETMNANFSAFSRYMNEQINDAMIAGKQNAAFVRLEEFGEELNNKWLSLNELTGEDGEKEGDETTWKGLLDTFRQLADTVKELWEREKLLAYAHPSQSPEAAALDDELAYVTEEFSRSIINLGRRAWRRYTHSTPGPSLEGTPKKGNDGDVDEEQYVKDDKIGPLKYDIILTQPVIELLVEDFKKYTAQRIPTRQACREVVLEQQRFYAEAAEKEKKKTLPFPYGPVVKAIPKEVLEMEQQEKWRYAARAKKAEAVIEKLEALIELGAPTETDGHGRETDVKTIVKTVKMYRKKVAAKIEVALTSEAAKATLASSRTFEDSLKMLDSFREWATSTGSEISTPETLHRVQKDIDEMRQEVAKSLSFVTDLTISMRTLANEVKGDRHDPKELKWTESELLVALQEKEKKIHSLSSEVDDLKSSHAQDLAGTGTGGDAFDRLQEALSSEKKKMKKLQQRLDESLAREMDMKVKLESAATTPSPLSERERSAKIDELEKTIKIKDKALRLFDHKIENISQNLENRSERILTLEKQRARARRRSSRRSQESPETHGDESVDHPRAYEGSDLFEDSDLLEDEGEDWWPVDEEEIHKLRAEVEDLKYKLKDREIQIEYFEKAKREGLEETDRSILQGQIDAAGRLQESLHGEILEKDSAVKELKTSEALLRIQLRKAQRALTELQEEKGRSLPEATAAGVQTGSADVFELQQELEKLRQEKKESEEQAATAWEELDRCSAKLNASEREERDGRATLLAMKSKNESLAEANEQLRRSHLKDSVELEARRAREGRRPSFSGIPQIPGVKEALERRAVTTFKITPSSPSPTAQQPRRRLTLKEAARMFTQLETDPEDAMPCGEGGAYRTKISWGGDNLEIEPEFAEAFQYMATFLKYRASIVTALARRNLPDAEKLLDQLEQWLRESRSVTREPWDIHFEYLEVEGSLGILRGALAQIKAEEYYGPDEGFFDLLKTAMSLVESVRAKNKEYTAMSAETSGPGTSPWELLGDHTHRTAQKMKRKPGTNRSSCLCRVRKSACYLHRHIDEACDRNLFHHLVKVGEEVAPEVYLEPGVVKALHMLSTTPRRDMPASGSRSRQVMHSSPLSRRSSMAAERQARRRRRDSDWRSSQGSPPEPNLSFT